MLRKIIAGILAAILVCSAFAGCGETESEKRLRESKESLKESQEKLGETYAEIFSKFGEFKKGVEDSDGITEYNIDAPIISQSDFDKLDEGMSYDEAMKTLGAETDSAASEDDMFMCSWRGANGGFIILNFFEGKLSYSTASNLS